MNPHPFTFLSVFSFSTASFSLYVSRRSTHRTYVRYPRVRFEYFLCRFVRRLTPSLTMMAPDRTRRALSIELLDVPNRSYLVPQKLKIPLQMPPKPNIWPTDARDEWLQVWRLQLQIELNELYRLNWSSFQTDPLLHLSAHQAARFYPPRKK